MHIFDCIIFNDELELLDARLHEWADVPNVTHLLVEHAETFQGEPKPLHFHDNRDLFAEFADRILPIGFDKFVNHGSPWGRENEARDEIGYELRNQAFCGWLHDDDLVIVTDADEIVKASLLGEIASRARLGPVQFPLPQHYYDLTHQVEGYVGLRSKAGLWRDVKEVSVGGFCAHNDYVDIENGGWHFSMLGGPQRVFDKLNAFSHQELKNDPSWVTLENVTRLVQNRLDVLQGTQRRELVTVPLDGPRWLCAQIAMGRWPYLLDPMMAFAEIT